MVHINVASYEEFKTLISSLAGGKAVPIMVEDRVVEHSTIFIVAVFASLMIVVMLSPSAKPPTFDADFPDAHYVAGIRFR